MTPTRSFLWLPQTHQQTAKQAFDSKTNEYFNAFLFGKLPVAIQNDANTASKQDGTVDEARCFFQRRYQYQQLMRTQQQLLFNEVTSGTNKRQKYHPTSEKTDQERKFSGTCFHLEALDWQTKKRERAQMDPPYTESIEQRPQQAQQTCTKETAL